MLKCAVEVKLVIYLYTHEHYFFRSVCAPTGYYIAHKNIPMLPMGCTDTELGDKNVFRTLLRLGSTYGKMGRAFRQAFQFYGWNRMAMFSREGDGSCDYGTNGIREAFRGTNITIAEWIKAPRGVTTQDMEEYLFRMRSRARSKFYCQKRADVKIRRPFIGNRS